VVGRVMVCCDGVWRGGGGCGGQGGWGAVVCSEEVASSWSCRGPAVSVTLLSRRLCLDTPAVTFSKQNVFFCAVQL
jgi:hypothetical protein